MSRAAITLGQYIPGDSLLHRLDPRFKLLALLFILVALFLLNTFAGLIALLLFAAVLALLSRVPLRSLLRGLRPILYIVAFTLVIYFFFTKGGVVWLRLGPVTVESVGVIQGLFVTARLAGLVFLTLLLTLTTTPLSLTHGLEFFMRPFQYLGLPVSETALVMSIALRFIPTLMEESQRLMRAQMARGADFESGGIFRRAKSLVPLIVPLFVGAFRRADELAVAMEARAFRVGARRTSLYEARAAARDWAALAFAAAVLAAAVLARLKFN